MACFCLKQRQDLENRAARPYQEFQGEMSKCKVAPQKTNFLLLAEFEAFSIQEPHICCLGDAP